MRRGKSELQGLRAVAIAFGRKKEQMGDPAYEALVMAPSRLNNLIRRVKSRRAVEGVHVQSI
jgi:hypothetical protein